MITFAHPQALWLLLGLPLLALLRSRRGPAPAVRYASVATARQVARTTRARLGRWLPYLRLPAAALLIVALARPQVAHASAKVKASGIDMMLALDVSGSMQALDLQLDGQRADRLTVVKSVVSKFIDARPNDRLGIVAFAGRPYLVSPLTLDHDWLQKSLDRVGIGANEDGTAIGSALAAAVNRLRPSDAKSKVVVLLTDGMNNSGSIQPSLAAKAAAALGIKVYTIAVGAEGRAPIPVVDDAGRRRIVMGEVEVDEQTLRNIASVTGGAFFRATDTDSLVAIYHRIDALEKTTRSVDHRERREERFAWAALPGLALLLAEVGLGATVLRRAP
ncbi:MAG TPA: VWA domain-containing protein [Polyangia bacterium]|nr:VWA domain-containing protein [Polyangia bacterium]